MKITESEQRMWGKETPAPVRKMSDDEINAKYLRREWRIVTETNREQLPNFVEALKRPGWMELRPFYQRRLRWDPERQSKLIESFIMNVPVPSLFVYEAGLAKFEVMDGQQRITAIKEFYSNELRLTGLEQWPEINGRTYLKLPTEIKKGIDRRSISYTVLLKESAETTEEQTLLRQLVFERLNTGGVKLSQQEVRNCLYQGEFNNLLHRLATRAPFRRAWELPVYSESEQANPPVELLENSFYSKMSDIEVVLRFFALRHADQYTRGMQGFLDVYMVRTRQFQAGDLTQLEALFDETIDLGTAIFGDLLFRPWSVKEGNWADHPHVAFSDAVMVGLARNLAHADLLLKKKDVVLGATQQLFQKHEDGTFTGRGNTKADVSNRINLFDKMLREVAAT